MKKSQIFVVVLVIIALFAGADYYINNLRTQVKLPKIPGTSADNGTSIQTSFPDSTYKLNQITEGYKVIGQSKVSQIFEKIDLSNIKNINIYQDRLSKTESSSSDISTGSADGAAAGSDSNIYVYEIHGPAGQGSLTYLNVKLQFIAQINATTEVLNETGEYGQNSFFYNDQDYPNIAFLLVQEKDNLFAFQYSKKDPAAYDSIKAIISQLTNSNS